MKIRALLATSLLGLAACAHGGGSSGSGDHSYGTTAKENYELGMKEAGDKNYLEAERYLTFVSAKFPYSSYSALAELGLADLAFQQDKTTEAIDKYRNFIKMHPTHPKDGYAAFQVGECYYQQMPSNFFLLPNAAEKDQSDEQNALQAFSEFLIQYPTSELRPKAEERVKELRHRLADHEMRIGDFYLAHDRAQAAVGRYETVLREYGNTDFAGAAVLKLHKAYLKLNEPEKAKAALQDFVRTHPGDPQADKAKRLLGS